MPPVRGEIKIKNVSWLTSLILVKFQRTLEFVKGRMTPLALNTLAYEYFVPRYGIKIFSKEIRVVLRI